MKDGLNIRVEERVGVCAEDRVVDHVRDHVWERVWERVFIRARTRAFEEMNR